MKLHIALIGLLAPAALLADIADVPETIQLPVRYVDEDMKPIEADYLPQQIRFRSPPIPGSIHGIPIPFDLIDIEANIGDTIEIDLGAIEERVSSIAMRMQMVSDFREAQVEPEDVRVVRMGTFVNSTTGVDISASVGMAMDAEGSLSLVLVWFDRAVDISGAGKSDELSFEFDIRIPGEGFWWIQYDEYETDHYRVTERRVDAEPYIAVEVKEIDWLVIEKSGDGFRLLGRQVEDADHLETLLDEVGAYGVMLDDEQDWEIGDIARLSPMVDASGRPLLFLDENGEVQWIDPGQSQ